MTEVLRRGQEAGIRHFFLGGSEELLATLVAVVRSRFPRAVIAGVYSPPFRALTTDELEGQDSLIAASSPDIVWVGLGAPKQDVEAQRITDTLGISTAAVGAAFDFLAGTKREAPVWVRQLRLEWLFRLLSEPRRLWRRYLFGGATFLHLVALELSDRVARTIKGRVSRVDRSNGES
jgi:N-acetylglucosaminyldiphosphoundecaprenol N-acetyl-beta-D-mannosaminyltransferase